MRLKFIDEKGIVKYLELRLFKYYIQEKFLKTTDLPQFYLVLFTFKPRRHQMFITFVTHCIHKQFYGKEKCPFSKHSTIN